MYSKLIRESGKTIYDSTLGTSLWIPSTDLEILLGDGLKGLELSGLKNRSKSKKVKVEICKILGYPVPTSFRRVKPKFCGQDFDVYIQQSNNLQIYNEGFDTKRRYVIVRVVQDRVSQVRVVSSSLLKTMTTEHLTSKYQARLGDGKFGLLSGDTATLSALAAFTGSPQQNPIAKPRPSELMPIAEIARRLKALIGIKFQDTGQERSRGEKLHQVVCQLLGYKNFMDKWPVPGYSASVVGNKTSTSLDN